MEALEFIKQKERMCDYYSGRTCTHDDSGETCPAMSIDCEITPDELERLVAIVEKWAKEHPEEAADATKPKQDETCGIKPEDFVNHFITEMLMRHEEQIEKLTQNVEELMKPVNAAEEPTAKPKRTNKDALLAAFPNARMDNDGIPGACPAELDKHYDCGKMRKCSECKCAHWLAEIEE